VPLEASESFCPRWKPHASAIRIFSSAIAACVAVTVPGMSVRAATPVQIGASGKSYATVTPGCALDPATGQGQQWHFGMKMHVGVDSQSEVIHTVAVTPANADGCKASPAQMTLARKFLTLSYLHRGHRT
jgi:IS5 family transposase